MAKKRIITVSRNELSPYELEGALSEVRDRLSHWIVDYGPNARLSWDPDHWPQYNDSPYPQYNIMEDREETDEEFEYRICREKIQQAVDDERDRKEFERLQKKYGGK